MDVDDKLAALNERYYSRSPHLYLEHRLSSLLVSAATLPIYGARLRDGIAIGALTISVDADEKIISALTPEDMDAFVTTESEVVLYHASETMFRLYLAHRARPQCPWIEMVSSMSLQGFRDQVDDLFGQNASKTRALDDLRTCYRLNQMDLGDHTEVEVDAAMDALLWHVRALARHLLSDHPMYNAAKHGLTMLAGNAYMSLHDDDGRPIVAHSGPSIEYLTATPWSPRSPKQAGTRRWSNHTVWFDPVSCWFLAAAAIEIMRSIWTIGRREYIGVLPDDHVWIPAGFSVKEFVSVAMAAGGRHDFRHGLFDERRPGRSDEPPTS